ncbi:MAG: signal peptide peptidase SppA [Candidatus Caldarchaeum sp.]
MDFLKKLPKSFKGFNTVEIELEEYIPEEEEGISIPFMPRKRHLTMWDIERIFFHALKAEEIRAVLIKMRHVQMGWSKAEAISRWIRKLRLAGKKVVVFAENPGNAEYLAGVSADRFFIPPWGILSLIGIKVEVAFLRDLLSRLGIEAIFKGLGEFKTAAEMFTRRDMSEPSREMTREIVDELYERFALTISESRGLGEEEVRGLIDCGPFTAKEARERKLIDEAIYESEVERKLEALMGGKVHRAGAQGFLRLARAKDFLRFVSDLLRRRVNMVALIIDSGFITTGSSRDGTGIKTLGARTIMRMLDDVEKNNDIKALVFRLSSPGGSGLASDAIMNRLKELSKKIPVVVSMSDVAASGGYMLALGARKVLAENSTLTGSIGIISGKFSTKGLLDKVGVNIEYVARGKHALMFSQTRGFSESEEETLERIMGSLYVDFVSRVAEKRGMSYERAEEVARGRVWTGSRAKALGLIDEIGGITEAIEAAAREAGITTDDLSCVRVVPKPRMFKVPMPKTPGLYAISSLAGFLKEAEREPLLLLMPFTINIK